MVTFRTFWPRLKAALTTLPTSDGFHYGKARKWSQHRGYLGGEFVFLFKGGNIIECGTSSTNKLRSVSSAEFEKVYAVWERYRSGEIPRSHITHDLGVQNSSWIIPILKKYEHLMHERQSDGIATSR